MLYTCEACEAAGEVEELEGLASCLGDCAVESPAKKPALPSGVPRDRGDRSERGRKHPLPPPPSPVGGRPAAPRSLSCKRKAPEELTVPRIESAFNRLAVSTAPGAPVHAKAMRIATDDGDGDGCSGELRCSSTADLPPSGVTWRPVDLIAGLSGVAAASLPD